MRTYLTLFAILVMIIPSLSQDINKSELAIEVSNANQVNIEKLKDYIWKRETLVYSNEEVKLTLLSEFSVNDEGMLEAKVIDAQSDVKKKRGLRGRAQSNAMEAKADYIEKGLQLLVSYGYMSKGNLIDFFDKANMSSENGLISIDGQDIYVTNDHVTLTVDETSNLFTKKEFTSFIGEDPVSGIILYETFKNGVSHISKMELALPSQNMKLDATNKDYSVRVK